MSYIISIWFSQGMKMSMDMDEFRNTSPVCRLIRAHRDTLRVEVAKLEQPFAHILYGDSKEEIPSEINERIFALHGEIRFLNHIVNLIDKSNSLNELDSGLKNMEHKGDAEMNKQIYQPLGSINSIVLTLNNLFKSITNIDLGFGRAKSATSLTTKGVASNDDSSPLPS